MARKLKDDEIKWILDLDAKGVQGEINKLSSKIRELDIENAKLQKTISATEKEYNKVSTSLIRLSNAGKQNTEEYKNTVGLQQTLQEQLKKYNSELQRNKNTISTHTKSIQDKTKSMKLSEMTMRQLIDRHRQLEIQLKMTSQAASPKAYKHLQKEYKAVGQAIETLKGKNKSLGTIISSTFKSRIAFGAMLGNVYTTIIYFVSQAITKVKEFVVESVKMAISAEGIDVAFNRIANKDYLKSLRQSTRGLVNDMELMKAAVRAENFKIPLDKLGNLLAFAQQRAKDTGESVDYLVESIVNGIGRKSPLILDNLGISAVALNEEVKKTGDFATAVAHIVEKEMSKVDDSVDLATDAVTRNKVAWENLQLELGKRFLGISNLWNKVSTSIAEGLHSIIGQNASAVDAYDDQIKKVANLQTKIIPLVGRYEDLKNKTELSVNEQSELNSILKTIQKNIPGVVTSVDKYGNALEINTHKVNAFIKAEELRLKYMHKDAIEEAEKNIKKREKEIEKLHKKTLQGDRYYTTESGRLVKVRGKYSEDEVNELKLQLEKKEKLLEEEKEVLKVLNGESYEEMVKKQVAENKQRTKFNAMTEKQLTDYIKMHKDASDKYIDIAKQIYSSRFEHKETDTSAITTKGQTDAERLAEKQADERKKIIKNTQITIDIETKAYHDRLKQFGLYDVEMHKMTEIQLRDRLSLDKEYYSKLQKIALEAENTRFKKAQEAAGVNEKSEGKQKKVYERLEQHHQANLQKIKDDAAKKQKDTQKQTDAAILKSIQEAGKASVDTVDAVESAKIFELKQGLAEKKKTQEQYDKELKTTEAVALADRLTVQEAYVQKLKDITHPTDEQKKALEDAEAAVKATQTKIYNNKINEEKAFQERRKAAIEQYGLETRTQQYDAEMTALRKQYDDGILTLEEYEKAKLLLKLNYAQQYVNQVGEFVQAGSDLVKSIEEAETANTQVQYAERHTALKEHLDNGVISHEEYNAKKEQLDYEQRVAELEVQKKYADANFAIQVAQIGVATATGIINAWASSMTLGPIAGPIAAGAMTAILLGTAGAQVASANAERKKVKALTIEAPSGGSSGDADKPKTGVVMLKDKPGGFADGGYTGDGDKYEIAGFLSDGRPFHRGEYFIAQEEIAHPAVVPMVRAIENIRRKRTDKNPLPAGFAEGGYTQPNIQSGGYVMIDEKLIVRFEKAVDKFEKTKLPVEINYWAWKEVEKEMDKINELTKRP